MSIIAHVSDLHFGREDPALVDGLLLAIVAANPDLLIVSGDFTQRARKKQFRAARSFLRKLNSIPQLVVPGNHDVSTTNLLERALRPLRRYKRYISADLTPFYLDDSVAVAGINTVRVLNTKDGRINAAQVSRTCQQLSQAPAGVVRIVVTHHPMDLPAKDIKNALVTRATAAMRGFSQCGVDLFVSGHLHGGLSLTSAARYPLPGYAAVVAHAGTAVSTRTRNEPNGWNLIRVETDRIEIDLMTWAGKSFEVSGTSRYDRTARGWISV